MNPTERSVTVSAMTSLPEPPKAILLKVLSGEKEKGGQAGFLHFFRGLGGGFSRPRP